MPNAVNGPCEVGEPAGEGGAEVQRPLHRVLPATCTSRCARPAPDRGRCSRRRRGRGTDRRTARCAGRRRPAAPRVAPTRTSMSAYTNAKSPMRIAAPSPNRRASPCACRCRVDGRRTAGGPTGCRGGSSAPSITSSCTSAHVCTISIAAQTSTTTVVERVAACADERPEAERGPEPLAARRHEVAEGDERLLEVGVDRAPALDLGVEQGERRARFGAASPRRSDEARNGKRARAPGVAIRVGADRSGAAAGQRGSVGAVQPFERLRRIARHSGDDRTLVAEAADCLAEFDTDPAGLVVTCRRLLQHHPDCAPLWWLCARVLAAPEPSDAAWEAEGLVRDDRTPRPPRGAAPLSARASDRGARLARARRRGARLAARPRSARGATCAGRRQLAPRASPGATPRRGRSTRSKDPCWNRRTCSSRSRPRAPPARCVLHGTTALLEQLTKPTTLVWLVAGVGRVLPGATLRRDERPPRAARGPRARARRRADRRPHRGADGARAPRAPDPARRRAGRARAACAWTEAREIAVGEAVLYELDGHVATITYNRPGRAERDQRRDAARPQRRVRPRSATRRTRGSRSSPAPGTAFCAGADITRRRRLAPASSRARSGRSRPSTRSRAAGRSSSR